MTDESFIILLINEIKLTFKKGISLKKNQIIIFKSMIEKEIVW